MNLEQLWQVFHARRRMYAWIVAAVVAGVALVSLVMPPTYVASTALVIDTRATDPVTGTMAPGQLSAQIIATQTDIIQSHNVALKVVDRLNLTKDPEFERRFARATHGAGSLRDWIADRIAERVSVRPSRDSNVIEILYPSHDAATAARFANALADAYMVASLELVADPARREARWFDAETRELRGNVDAAQARLAAAARATHIVGTSDHLDVDAAKLTEISRELVAAQQTLYESRTRQQQMAHAVDTGSLESQPEVLSDPLLQSLKTELARAEANLAEISARYDRNHPQYQSAAATVNALRHKLVAEVQSVRASVDQTAQMNEREVEQLQRALDQQKATLLDEERNHDSLDVLNREVESAQRAYEAGLQRATQVHLASQLDQSTVAVLNPAVAPYEASRPRPVLYVALALVFGLILGAAACIVAELLDARVRSATGLLDGCGLVVLAEVPRLGMPPPRALLKAAT
jgi:chain length determinant protein EpsF